MSWSGGIAEWVEGDTAYLSVVFSWRLPDAYSRGAWYRASGRRVIAGGPAVFFNKEYLSKVAEIGEEFPDAIMHHNPNATIASRGCPVGCSFCIVPVMEGKTFTLLPDFTPRPILCDNNLSALPVDYQEYIIQKYRDTNTPLLDVNSGFEPLTFDIDCYHRWKAINRGPWRLAFDEMIEAEGVKRAMNILRDEPSFTKRIYVLLGNEPMENMHERSRK